LSCRLADERGCTCVEVVAALPLIHAPIATVCPNALRSKAIDMRFLFHRLTKEWHSGCRRCLGSQYQERPPLVDRLTLIELRPMILAAFAAAMTAQVSRGSQH
jgi:hypothetical protein